jgi:hydrogenase large subunit
MPDKIMLKVPLNRVEGDLEIKVEVQDGFVTDAWSSGIMYRGFENLLKGRGALDGLVLTPRICGICGTAHLLAAAHAIEMIQGVSTPPAARRLRSLALMVEKIQSDMRHGFLMFAPDFINPAYHANPLFETACQRYRPYSGQSTIECLQATRQLVEIIALIGGQWPHSAYMIPGGLTAMLSSSDLLQCRLLIARFKAWYEQKVLGCSLQRWLDVKNAVDLELWLEQSDSHRQSEIGFFLRYGRSIGLGAMGSGHGNFICFGNADPNRLAQAQDAQAPEALFASGFATGSEVRAFDQEKIAEYVDFSWYHDYTGGRHPFSGETRPYAADKGSSKYSWVKAVRYDAMPAETGPLAEMIIGRDPLFYDWIRLHGPSVLLRQLARLVRAARLIPAIEECLARTTSHEDFYTPAGEVADGQGFGLLNAARGGLGHWVTIEEGKIAHYQVITPTAWNASPRDAKGIRGPWEQALIGTPVKDRDNPVELGHVIRSFDACLYCSIHIIDAG